MAFERVLQEEDAMKYLAKSAVRAVDLLVYFRERNEPRRASEIADDLHIARSSANQLLKSLVEKGYLVFNRAAKTYVPAPALLGFAGWLTRYYCGSDWMAGIVSYVHERTGQIATIVCENDLFMEVIEARGADLDPLFASRYQTGLRLPIIGSVSGGIVLARLDKSKIARLAYYTRWSGITDCLDIKIDELLAFAERVRRQGVAESFRDRRLLSNAAPGSAGFLELRSIVVPVLSPKREFSMGVGLGARCQDFERLSKDYVSIVVEAIERFVPLRAQGATYG